jgi:thioredoxin-like negative regulator of GroEL
MATPHLPIPGFVPKTPPVTSASIASVMDAHTVVVIHFWAAWNGADPPMDERLASITGRLPFKTHFTSCNVDDPECVDLCKRCGVANIPYLAVIVDGELRPGIMGLHDVDDIVSQLTDSVPEPQSPRPWWRIW